MAVQKEIVGADAVDAMYANAPADTQHLQRYLSANCFGDHYTRTAQTHGQTPAQVMLRWHLQQGRSTIPKSTRPARIAENIDIFDFELTPEQLGAIDELDTGRRGGPEPDDITLANFGRPIPEA